MIKWFLYLIGCLTLTLTFVILGTKNFYAETNTVSSTVVNNTPPTANAPVVPNSNSDICKVGIGGAVQNNVLGIATGVLVDDELCQLLKLSRSQFAYGMKVSAVALLCQDPRVWTSMQDAGTPCPVNGLIGQEAADYWAKHPHLIPDGSRYKAEYVEANKPEPKEFSDAQNVAMFKTFFLITTGLLLF
tara:strand:- start:233 stop:796 length:564 start_codon:yes stop_codon:yes gene_type:complete